MTAKSLAPLALLASAALLLTGCVNNETPSPGSSGSAAAVTVEKDDAAAKLLPEDVASSGKLVVGTDATYAPNEFKDADGNPTGWEIELADAMAAKLGLKTEYTISKFDNIIPGITGGKYDVGVSSFFDTVERQQQVDMIDYYTAGIQWAAPKGKTVDPDNACGLKLAVQNGTTEALEDGPAKSEACVAAGKPASAMTRRTTPPPPSRSAAPTPSRPTRPSRSTRSPSPTASSKPRATSTPCSSTACPSPRTPVSARR
jgi:polar amino acid transport system substrate-binding protein